MSLDEAPALTPREQEVLRLILAGHTRNRELAAELTVSEWTVDRHVSRIMDKLEAHNRAELVLRAFATGLA